MVCCTGLKENIRTTPKSLAQLHIVGMHTMRDEGEQEIPGRFVAGPWKYFILIDMAPGQQSGQLVLKLEVPLEVYQLVENQWKANSP